MLIVPARACRATALAVGCALIAVACARDKQKSSPDVPVAAAAASGAASVPNPSPIDLVPLPPDIAAGELKDYRLSLDRLQRWGRAQKAMNALTTQHPEIVNSMTQQARPTTLDQEITMIGSEPHFRALFKDTGTNAHDYVITMVALQQAMQGFQRVAAGTPLPADLPPALAANITFVQQNLPAIQKLLGPMRR